MRRLRKIGLALLVGLTATSTLLAGVPHFVCHCPNGQVKSFCLSSPSTTGCCCGGACCGTHEAAGDGCCCKSSNAKAGGCCCCGDRDPEDASQPANDPGSHDPRLTLQHNCCTRTLAIPEAQSLSESKTTATASVDDSASLTFKIGAYHSRTPLTHASIVWLAERGPPPADLVIVLRHLTI
jgi:hypothetical protein